MEMDKVIADALNNHQNKRAKYKNAEQMIRLIEVIR